MATLDYLKRTLRQKAEAAASSPTQPLSDIQYSAGFDTLVQGSGWTTYQDFIIPQLSQMLGPLFHDRTHTSVLEIGPGPRSVLGYLPSHMKRKIKRYTAFEPNDLFATILGEWLCSTSEAESPLPSLESPPGVHQIPFVLDNDTDRGTGIGTSGSSERFDVILFCHSMYGMKPKHKFIERALGMLVEKPEGGMVVVFHRDGNLHLDGLVCHRTASFPTAVTRVANKDDVLDCFAPFIAGFIMQDVNVDKAIRAEWRKVCRTLGSCMETHPDSLSFSSPISMAAFTQHATALPELMARVPSAKKNKMVKNREARLHGPAAVLAPTKVLHVQQCARWALKYGVGLTIIGGSHSSHCRWPHVVSLDMGAFDQISILVAGENRGNAGTDHRPLVVVEAGCTTGDIIQQTMAAGVTFPLGARPSVGAGSWLQGGIGHLARIHGLACDAIVGAVVVSVDTSEVLCIGHVPSQHLPAGAVRPDHEADLLWAIKGAGTNFGIVISVTFQAYPARTFSVRNWVVPMSSNLEAQRRLDALDQAARDLPWTCSADAYLYGDDTNQLQLGVTTFESSTRPALISPTPMSTAWGTMLGSEDECKIVDGIGLFGTEMYMSGMHGGHGGGKTSSFKRCVFLRRLAVEITAILVAAITARPTPLCYLHLLHGGGAVGDVAADATAFGCRDWEFACVVTGVWPRDQDGTETGRAAVRWVYQAVQDLLQVPACSGAYGADLGPDSRDAPLAARAFGSSRARLARLKYRCDPRNVLAYTCPLPLQLSPAPVQSKLIILVTGDSCAGKDYTAAIWVSILTTRTSSSRRLTARTVSISDAIKREYAEATGADLRRLLGERAYKEQHRPALTAFFHDRVRQRPRLPEEHFRHVVDEAAAGVDVLLITGVRDEAPVAAWSHLVPDSRLLEIRVTAREETRRVRRGDYGTIDATDENEDGNDERMTKDERDKEGERDKKDERNKKNGQNKQDLQDSNNGSANVTGMTDCPSLVFNNDTPGDEPAKRIAEDFLLPFFHEDLQRLADMVRAVPEFPRPGIEFRHVLDIAQQPGGLALCASLLQTRFTGHWAKVDVVACCEAGGLVYASALAARVDIPLALIRNAGKLPPPTISAIKRPSHMSSLASNDSEEKRIEIGRNVIPRGALVVVVDDVLATGETLCAVLQLLIKAGIGAADISVMAVAEFPLHHGRELLRRRGFGGVNIQSLLVFGGT